MHLSAPPRNSAALLLAVGVMFTLIPSARAQTVLDITTSGGPIILPGGGGTATVFAVVTRDGGDRAAIRGNDPWTVVNHGTLTNHHDSMKFEDRKGVVVLRNGNSTLVNYATIAAGINWGAKVYGTVQNHGTICASRDLGLWAISQPVVNHGTISAGRDIGVKTTGNVENNGSITAGRNTGVSVAFGTMNNNLGADVTVARDEGVAIHIEGTLNNSGTIFAGGDTAVYLMTWGGHPSALHNDGVIHAAGNYGVRGSIGSDLVVNAGTIRGDPTAIYLGSNDDTVVLQTGSQVIGAIDGGGGTDTLRLAQSGVLDSVVRNMEILEKLDPGNWDITVPLTIGTVQMLNGSLTTPVLTIDGGRFSGVSRINGSVANEQGTLAPGTSIGTLTVNGDYAQNGGVAEVEVAPNGQSDRLVVTGRAQFNGVRVHVLPQNGRYRAYSRYEIVQAGGGVSGTLGVAGGADISAVLYWDVHARANTVELALLRRSYGSFAETRNQQAAGLYLDGLARDADGDLATVLDVIDYLPADAIDDALDEFAPTESDAFAAAALAGAHGFAETTSRRINEMRWAHAPVSEGPDDGWHLWGQALDRNGDAEGGPETRGYQYGIQGVAIGCDRTWARGVLAGAAVEISESDIDWEAAGNDGQIGSVSLGVYAHWARGNTYVDTTLGCGLNKHDGTRRIRFGTVARAADLEYDARHYSASLRGGHDLRLGRWSVGALTALSYARLDEDGYTEEDAGALNLAVDSRTSASLQSALGVRAAWSYSASAVNVVPYLNAQWTHEFEDDGRDMNAQLAGRAGGSFTVTGLPPESDAVQAGAGLSVRIKDRTTLFGTYSTSFSDGAQVGDACTLGMRVRL